MSTRPLFLEATAGGLLLGMVRSEADFARLADEWPRTPVPFRSHDWLHTWWRHFGRRPRRELAVLTVRDGARLCAVLPLYREHGPLVRRARLLGTSSSRHLGLVGDDACAPALADALTGALRARFFDFIDAAGIDAAAPLWRALAGGLDEQFAYTLQRPESTAPTYRRVAGFDVETLTTPAAVAGAFGDLLRLAKPGWSPAEQAFHRDAILQCRGAELHFLIAHGRRRAAAYGFGGVLLAHSPSRVLRGRLDADLAGGDACIRVAPVHGAFRFFHVADRLYRLVKGAA